MAVFETTFQSSETIFSLEYQSNEKIFEATFSGSVVSGVKRVDLTDDGDLLITYANGSVEDLGSVREIDSNIITSIWCGSLSDYNAISNKSDTTLYFIEG